MFRSYQTKLLTALSLLNFCDAISFAYRDSTNRQVVNDETKELEGDYTHGFYTAFTYYMY